MFGCTVYSLNCDKILDHGYQNVNTKNSTPVYYGNNSVHSLNKITIHITGGANTVNPCKVAVQSLMSRSFDLWNLTKWKVQISSAMFLFSVIEIYNFLHTSQLMALSSQTVFLEN